MMYGSPDHTSVEQGLETEMRMKTRNGVQAKKDREEERFVEQGVLEKS